MGRVAVAAWLLLACLLPGSSTVQPPGRAIPRILHQTNTLPSVCPRAELVEVLPGKLLNKVLAGVIVRLRRLNPHWEYRLWDHQDIAKFFATHRKDLHTEFELQPHEDIQDIYNSINPHYGAARSDFIRYLILYLFGGVYFDLKSLSRVPLDKLLQPEDGLVLAEWDLEHFPGWGYWGDDGSGRGKEFPNWFIASAPRHPAMRSVILNLLTRFRHYPVQCLELKACPTGLLYRFRPDGSFNHSYWPRARKQCFGLLGTLVVTGPIVFTSAIIATAHEAGPAAESLRIRVLDAHTSNHSKHLVYNFERVSEELNMEKRSKRRERLYCGGTSYHLLQEPIYLPLSTAIGLFHRRASIAPEPAVSLDCPPLL